jgi:ATP-dependent Clp protease ATP-binding subunit ClpA
MFSRPSLALAEDFKRSFHFSNGNKALFHFSNSNKRGLEFRIELKVADSDELLTTLTPDRYLSEVQDSEDVDNSPMTPDSLKVETIESSENNVVWFGTNSKRYLLLQDGTLSETCTPILPSKLGVKKIDYSGVSYIVESYNASHPLTYIKRLSDSTCMLLDQKFHSTREMDEFEIHAGILTVPNIQTSVDLNEYLKLWRIQHDGETFEVRSSDSESKVQTKYGTSITRVSDKKSQKIGRTPITNSSISDSLFSIEHGVLTVESVFRQIDLDRFDAELRRFNKIGSPDPVQNEDGFSINIVQEMRKNYVDWVEEAKLHPEAFQESSDKFLISEMADAVRAKRSIVVLGRAGTGKTSAIRAFARDVGQGKIPGIPRTLKIFEIKASNLGSGTKFVGTIEKRMSVLVAAAKELGCILFFDEIHSLAGLGTSTDNSNDVTQFIKGPLERGEMIVFGTDTTHEFNNSFAKDPAFAERFEQVFVKPPVASQLIEVIKAKMLSEFEAIPEARVIERAIYLSNEYDLVTAQPRAAINLLRKAYGQLARTESEDLPLTEEVLNKAAIAKYKLDFTVFDRRSLGEKLRTLQENLKGLVIGQSPAKKAILSMWKTKLTGVGDAEQVNSILLVGAPGIGKSKLAEASADLMGYEKSVLEMNKYQLGDVEEFRRDVYSALLAHPFRVFVLDEIENAPIQVQEAALSMLQSGEFTVVEKLPYGKTVSRTVNARHSLFVMTSNMAADYIETCHRDHELLREETLRAILAGGEKSERKSISIKILSRLQRIVPMYRPSQKQFKLGLKKVLEETLDRETLKHGATFVLEDADEFIEARGEHFNGSVSDFRDVKRLIKEVEENIADAILSPSFEQGKEIRIPWNRKLKIKRLNGSGLPYFS